MKRLTMLLAGMVLVGIGWAFLAPSAYADGGLSHCQELQLPVSLTDGGPKTDHVFLQHCMPATWAPGPHQADVLTAGATYNHAYWDWPQQSELYSYVNKTLQAGRATFNYDRIGTGQSSRPSGLTVTLDTDAVVLHQVIQYARSLGYESVNSIGHSLGSLTAVQEAGRYPTDPSRVVATGLLHQTAIGLGFPVLFANLRPATLDPLFFGDVSYLDYLTTAPGSRDVFHSASSDPAIVAYDDAHKDVFSSGELASAVTALELPPGTGQASKVTAPVLVLVGQQDALFCGLLVNCAETGALQQTETAYYGTARSVTVASTPGAGHDITLHPSMGQSFLAIDQWIRTH